MDAEARTGITKQCQLKTMSEEQNHEWDYFLGRTGNLNDYPRKGCQYLDIRTMKWRKCLEDVKYPNNLKFIMETKYRRPASLRRAATQGGCKAPKQASDAAAFDCEARKGIQA